MYVPNLVSIIMPAYNAEEYISEAIQSVLDQTYDNYELIVINDCSTDSTRSIVQSYAEKFPKVKLINNEKNIRVAYTRNNGIKSAKGQYIAFLDSDDKWLPNKLELQIKSLSNTNNYFSFGTYDLINSRSKKIGKRMKAPKTIDYNTLLKGSKIGCLTVMVDRSKINQWYDMKNIGHEDYLTWLKLLKDNGPAVGIQEPIALYRSDNESLSSNKKRVIKWQFDIYRKELNLSTVKSAYYLGMYAINALTKYTKVSIYDE